MEAGVSPTGARTYQIPIVTAAGFKLTPSIALGYNSQAGEGWGRLRMGYSRIVNHQLDQ